MSNDNPTFIGFRMKYRLLNIIKTANTRLPIVPLLLLSYVVYAALTNKQYALSSYDYVSPIENLATAYELGPIFSQNSHNTNNNNSTAFRPTCPIPQYNEGDGTEFVYDHIRQTYSPLLAEMAKENSIITNNFFNTELGGEWNPLQEQSNCESIQRVAIVVPYRNRPEQLKQFLLYIHPFLQRQMIHYKVFIVEQAGDNPFNRGKLLNIGFDEASKEKEFNPDCFIFHDVDLLPENLRNLYACTHKPRHMSAVVDSFRYTLQYEDLFGGVTSMLPLQYELANGYSNNYEGWGGEDDDMLNRIKLVHREAEGSPIVRYAQDVSAYRMIPHRKRKPSEDRHDKVKSTSTTFKNDGLNSLKYRVIQKRALHLYTIITVDINETR